MSEKEERDALIRAMLTARTVKEIREAERKAERWLKTHPLDTAVLSAGEGLYMLRTALEEQRDKGE